MKKILFFFLLLTGALASQAYDFSAVAPTGQTLYYEIMGSLVKVTYPNADAAYVSELYDGYTAPEGDLTVPATVTYNGITYSVTSIGNYAFYNCSSLTSVTIPNSVTSIGGSAFYNCNSLTSVTIPNSVTSIGVYAFSGCSELTSVNYTGTVGEWCGITFSDYYSNPLCYAQNLYINGVLQTTITITDSVTSIGNNAFVECTSLTSVTIPNSVTSIGNNAFVGCISLTNVTIPNSVTSIGGCAFSGCSSLTEITSLSRTAPWLGDNVFYGVNISLPVSIPCGSQMSYLSRWSYFSNFIEAQGFSFEANSGNVPMGAVEVLTQPTCSAPQAVINAVPTNGYQFDHWSNGVTENPYSLTLTCDTTLTAFFVLREYDTIYIHDTIVEQLTYYTLSVISGNNNRGLVAGNGTFPEGTEVEIAAIPIQGNTFVQWVDGNTENPRRVIVNGNMNYVATFEACPVGMAEVEGVNFTIGTENGAIVVKDAPEMQVRIFDNLGRCMITNKGSELVRMFNMPATGTYMVQVGNYPAQKVVVVR